MKKTVLLSVIASTMIMAGGDIAPVEPVVEAPAPAPVEEASTSGWTFNGEGVVYYQTIDAFSAKDLFAQETSVADAGIRLKAENKSIIGGFGAGVAVNGLATLNLEDSVVSNVMQTANGNITGGWISEGYLTYGIGNTMLKIGRQTLPGSLSPFAHSENWNVFENTYDAGLLVNSDIPDTTLVYAFVWRNNSNGYPQFVDATGGHDFLKTFVKGSGEMATFGRTNGEKGVHMISAQNKSISGLALTGSWYYGQDFVSTGNDLNILWGSAAFEMAGFDVAVQGGQVSPDTLNKTIAYGAKAGGKVSIFSAHVAYSHVDDGATGVFNVGGEQTPLYTQMIINEGAIAKDNDTFTVGAGLNLLGGTLGAGYGYTTDNSTAENDYQEIDVYYTTDIGGLNLLAGYVNMSYDKAPVDANNVVRLVTRYKF